MNYEVNFIERKHGDSVSIERVFRCVANELAKSGIRSKFQKLPYGNAMLDVVRNLRMFRPVPADVFHITGHAHYIALILPPERTVLTVHDLVILELRWGIRRFVLRKILFDLPIKRLKYITTVSAKTKDELVKLTRCNPAKIRVVDNPLLIDVQAALGGFNQERPVILQIGTAPNKNLSNLIKALEGIDCHLRIIGHLDEAQIRMLRDSRVSFDNASDLDDDAINEEYRKCDILAFCSTLEGFGLPIIEAQAFGKPVVTSDISPVREVAGDAAILVDPHDPQSIRAGILTVINNPDVRLSNAAKGLENTKRFAPRRVSISYRAIYEELLNNLAAEGKSESHKSL